MLSEQPRPNVGAHCRAAKKVAIRIHIRGTGKEHKLKIWMMGRLATP